MNEIKLNFLGTRGSTPVNGEKFSVFGGATACVFARINKKIFVLDVGSGFNSIVDFIEKDDKEINLFISHTHADHIIGLPLCPLMFNPDITVNVFGKTREGLSIKEQLDKFMCPPIWPFSTDAFIANVNFYDLKESFSIDDVKVSFMEGDHLGGVTLYKFQIDEKVLVYASDTVIDKNDEKLNKFVYNADILIADGQYDDKVSTSFGHSFYNKTTEFAKHTQVNHLFLFHHSPTSTDEILAKQENEVKTTFPNAVFAKCNDEFILQDATSCSLPVKKHYYKKISLSELLKISIDLTAERNSDELLERILRYAMELSNCDGGTLYIKNENSLEFKIMITKSKEILLGGIHGKIDLPPIEFSQYNVCTKAAFDKKIINIENVYKNEQFDFTGPIKFDKENDYKTRSMLVIPMLNNKNEVIGALQLINSQDENGNLQPFAYELQDVLKALASQAATCLSNVIYTREIQELMESMAQSFAMAIYSRTPYNVNHTKNMARYAENFISWYNDIYCKENSNENSFPKEHEKAFLMAVWLHDVGKLATPTIVMDKATRLGKNCCALMTKFDYIILLEKYYALIENRPSKELDIEKIKEFVKSLDNANFIKEEELEKIEEIKKLSYKDLDGKTKLYLSEMEYDCLTIVKGTLTKEERSIMEKHVTTTRKILGEMKFTREYEKIPLWAANHHEFLNNTGYPRKVGEKDLDEFTRFLTIIDIFDGISSADRPYKKSVSIEKTFSILDEMVKAGKIDGEILNLFKKSKAWKK